MWADGCAAGSYKGAAVRGVTSRVVGTCVEGAGVTHGGPGGDRKPIEPREGRGLRGPKRDRESSRANAMTHLLTKYLLPHLLLHFLPLWLVAGDSRLFIPLPRR